MSDETERSPDKDETAKSDVFAKSSGDAWAGASEMPPVSPKEGRSNPAGNSEDETFLRLNFALKAARLGAFELNLLDHTAWRSPGHAEIFGYTESVPDWSFQMFLQHVLPDDREWIKRLVDHARTTKTELMFETQIQRADGSARWIWVRAYPLTDAEGIVTKLFGVVQDITDRKLVEKTLRQERDLLQSVMDGANNSHLVYLDRNFNFVRVNAAYAKTCGYCPDEMVGKNHFDLYPNSKIEALFNRVRDTGEPLEIHDQPFEFPDQPERGTTFWDWTLTPVKDAEGGVLGFVFALVETTERKSTEEKQLNIQKLDALGNLAAGIAHDFNNLLAGMFGYVEIAIDEIRDNEPTQAEESLQRALLVFERTKALTRQLLTFAEGGAPIRKMTESAPMIRHIANTMETGGGASLSVELEEDLWPCNCDQSQIEQAVGNVILNALQAEPKGGKVQITAKNERIASERRDLGKRSGNFIRISVRDHGSGISKEHLSKIYDPFFTTKEMGRGLGLSVSHSIISRHGGFILVETDLNEGAVFHVFLPASVPDESLVEKEQTKTRRRRARILVMDDEQIIRETMGTALSRMGYEVAEAEDGREAMALFLDAINDKRTIDLVILDLVVHNGMDGRETVKAIRERDTQVPVFAVSGYADDPAMSNPVKYGFTASILKPFRREELRELVETHLTR